MTEEQNQQESSPSETGGKSRHNDQVMKAERRSSSESGRRRSDSRFSFAVFLCFVFGVSGLALSGYVFYEQYTQKTWRSSVNSRLTDGEDRIALLEPLSPGVMQLSKDIENIEEREKISQELIERKLTETLEAVDRRMGVTSEDWIMAEVEYLVRLASQRVTLDTDTRSAIKLLKNADAILHQAEIVTAFNVRNAIANDLIKLDGINQVDRQGIFAQLSAVGDMIENLQQKKYEFHNDVAESDSVTNQSDLSWQDYLVSLGARVWGSVSSLVDFRRNDSPVEPLLPMEEEYYLKHNLRLKLETARFALVRSEQHIFEGTIFESIEWVEKYFEPSDAITQVVMENLNNLSSVKIAPEAANVDESLREIRKYMERFKSLSASKITVEDK